MQAVLTGDIIDSRAVENPEEWIAVVEGVLGRYGTSPRDWEIFRGDSFQLETKAEKAFEATFHLKAALHTLDLLDARISIGLGDVKQGAKSVRLNSGSAFIYSGEAFDTLKSTRRTLVLNCEDEILKRELNMMLQLSEGLITHWTQPSAMALKKIFETPGIAQTQLASELGITQPSVSSRLKVAHVEEIFALIDYYSYRIKMMEL